MRRKEEDVGEREESERRGRLGGKGGARREGGREGGREGAPTHLLASPTRNLIPW